MKTQFKLKDRLLLILFSLMVFAPTPAKAAFSPLAISIVPPVQFPGDDYSITGARISVIYGNQRDVYGLDLGLIGNVTQQDFTGIAVSGAFNITKGKTTAIGLQAAGLTNWNTGKTRVVGLQLAGVLNKNVAASQVIGLQLSLVNLVSHTDIYGFQLGLFNKAQNVRGFQIGIVNVAKNLKGIQIGLVNFNNEGIFKVSPGINIGF